MRENKNYVSPDLTRLCSGENTALDLCVPGFKSACNSFRILLLPNTREEIN